MLDNKCRKRFVRQNEKQKQKNGEVLLDNKPRRRCVRQQNLWDVLLGNKPRRTPDLAEEKEEVPT